jgi:1-acyl-sn-glycerol-3-phosphate acyltransferase
MAGISRRWAGALLAAAVISGCGGKLEYTEVNGTVTLDNEPLAGVSVAFFPEGQRSPLVARGTTDSAGRYTLTGPDGRPIAVVGTNRVVVLPPKAPRSAGDPMPPPGPPVPARYTVPKLTPLVVEVQAGGPQTINLSLVSGE